MAGLVPRSFINDIIAKADIVDVVNSRVKLKKAGTNNYQACCPFHHEKTPSFTVSKTKQFYHCFGCGAHGNVLSFLMEYDKLEFVEAIEELAGMLGLDVPREESRQSDKPYVNYQTKKNLYELMQDITTLYQQQLLQSQPAQDYLQQRGLSDEIIQRFSIGFVPDSYDLVVRQFGKNKEEQERLFSLGMVKRSERGTMYDTFRHRVMFPIRDRRGRVIAFGGRVMGDDMPKYLNSPDTVTYHKGNELYGLFEALQVNDSPEKLLVVEGYMDVVALAQFGVDYAVASLGTATTPEQINQLFRTTEQVVCCYDGDRAGRSAAWRALENALPYLEDGRQLKFVFLPDGEDPDSYIRQYGKLQFEDYLQQAQSLSDFLFDHLLKDVKLETKEGKSKLAALAVPLIGRIPGNMLRIYLRNMLASKLGIIDPNQIELLLPNSSRRHESAVKKMPEVKRTPMRLLIALLLQNPKLALEFDYDASSLASLNEPGLALFDKLTALCRNNVGITLGQILEYFRDTEDYKPLEILATWDHLIEEEHISTTYIETYNFLLVQIVERRIEQLIAQDRTDGLDGAEKQELAHLLTVRAK
ncbi:DNA primase [Lonepinella koalarum]|uniref:DNA primase n=1 Tax=Lonepinella koalarum TaxID=53417 RepID=A0A4R1L001_9PAST|nr:DNA primase [Lonepinella koalarum]MDH2926444.1 DNA primase [Lonepinella koalarum]TCK69619.1 DNA primase [Lonepinella koalarum]TFJ89861.1 DNA primase [Lonepinella koalarum]